jgi:hypothetical protein
MEHESQTGDEFNLGQDEDFATHRRCAVPVVRPSGVPCDV